MATVGVTLNILWMAYASSYVSLVACRFVLGVLLATAEPLNYAVVSVTVGGDRHAASRAYAFLMISMAFGMDLAPTIAGEFLF